ncbi:unknown [Bacteroides sp. CAG:702]|nr:unknown [Bacteroides sp. CAG:702]
MNQLFIKQTLLKIPHLLEHFLYELYQNSRYE